MRVLAGYGAADSGRMHANIFGDFLDHHRLQLVNAALQEIELAPHDRLADFEDGLLALLDVLHELDRAGISFLDVIADFLIRLLIPVEHAQKTYDAAINSPNKKLVVLGPEDGGVEHCSIDNGPLIREIACDWIAEVLRAEPEARG